jgi:hypothetical protein
MKIILTLAMSLSLYAQTASLLPPVKAQFLNADGTPMVGGKVCTYQAGTTTPQQTYVDSTLGTPNSNPVVLDARGEANIWLSSANPYKIVLRMPGGVSAPFATACSDTSQVYSVDNVSSASGGGGGGGGSTLPVDDTTAIVQNVTDNTKQVRISAASLSPFQTRILTMPDTNLTVAGRDVANTFTQIQTFGANLVPSTAGFYSVGTQTVPFSSVSATDHYAVYKPGGLCNYAGMSVVVPSVIQGGLVYAQDSSCATQAQMSNSGFDTVNTLGQYHVQGQAVITADRYLANIAGVATNLIPTTDGTRDLGSLALKYREIYANQALIDSVIPNTAGSLVGTFAVPYGQGNFENLIAKTTLRVGTSTTAGWILTADASGFASWAAAPTGTLPSQTGNNGKYLTTDGTNASWATVSGSGISSLEGQTGATQTFADDTNVTITSAANVHTLGWTGQLAAARGGTGLSAFTRTGNTTQFATWSGATTATRCVETDASGNLTVAAGACGTSGGIASLNLLTGADQTLVTGTSFNDFTISSSGTAHTFHLPSASGTARGVVTTGAQTIAGLKTFTGGIISDSVIPSVIGSTVGTSGFPYGQIWGVGLTAITVGGSLADIRARNAAGSKIGKMYDNGTDIELSINNGSTNFLVNGSNLVFGLTATTQSLLPSTTHTYDVGSTSFRYSNYWGRNINLQTPSAGFSSGISMRNSSGQTRAEFSASDSTGGEFSIYDSGGSNIFNAINGVLRYNGNNGVTGTYNCGSGQAIKNITVAQGGITSISCGTP